jgi:signal transduction histidine kinase
VEVVVDIDGRGGRRLARVVVADRGRRPRPADGSAHFGVVGMVERARALGGDLRAAPTADGWRVEATIPVDGPGGGRGAG